MSKYIDGFVLVVPKKNTAQYRKMAVLGRKMWLKYGALDYKECMGEEMKTKSMGGMKPLEFPKLAKAKSNEHVWFSFIVFKSKKHRNAVNAKVIKAMMADPKSQNMSMPFDMKRFAYGGFKVIVDTK